MPDFHRPHRADAQAVHGAIAQHHPERFETERLPISMCEQGDGKAFYQFIRTNSNYLQEELSETRSLQSVEDAEAYIR